jgi:hypothetical protein
MLVFLRFIFGVFNDASSAGYITRVGNVKHGERNREREKGEARWE